MAKLWTPLDTDYLVPTPGETWCLVQVADDSEQKLAEYCRTRGLTFVMSVVGESDQAAPTVAWPGYVFCRLSTEWQEDVRRLKFVRDVSPVPDETQLFTELRSVQSQSLLAQEQRRAPWRYLTPGQPVRLLTGPLAGRTVSYVRLTRKNRVSVRLVPENREIEVDAGSLEVAQQEPDVRLAAVMGPSPSVAKDADLAFEAVNTELIKFLLKHPDKLYELQPRRFEELVAELMVDMGFDVQLTPPSKDGGRDILATVRLPIGEVLTIVECKRYAREHRIGPDIVQRLLWISDNRDRASRAMIATTTFFTSGARQLADEFRWKLSLADFNEIYGWLGRHGRWSQTESSGLWIPRFSDATGGHHSA